MEPSIDIDPRVSLWDDESQLNPPVSLPDESKYSLSQIKTVYDVLYDLGLREKKNGSGESVSWITVTSGNPEFPEESPDTLMKGFSELYPEEEALIG